tara:strand:+ start:140 stop:1396 length:1257 start_codon:yes stop_codon:yes gene_type:complete
MAIKYNPLDPFGTKSLFDDINKTNQQINSMNLPQPKPKNPYRQQNIGNILLAFSDVLKGRDPSAGVMQRKALIDAKQKEAQRKADIETFLKNNPQFRQAYELKEKLGMDMQTTTDNSPNSYREYVRTDSTPTQEEYKTFLDRNQKPASAGTMYEIVDGNNNDSFVGNISANEYQTGGYKKYADAGIDTSQFKLKGLSAGTEAASTSGDKKYDSLYKKFRGTNTLIGSIQGLADQYAAEPLTGLAVGNAAQFVDSVIQNIDSAGNMLSGKDYTNVQNSGFTTIEGKDFSDQIKQVSGETGVSESRVRDLAYLFAASRGQEGKGLSDKDYENALRIVSGGVGAEGKIKVLEDVAVRVGQEVQDDLDFVVRNLPADVDTKRYSTLRGSLPTFVNPYSINMQSITPSNNDAVINNLLKKYGG